MSPPQPSSLGTEHLVPLLARMQKGDLLAAEELFQRSGRRLELLAHQMLRHYPVVRSQAQTGDVVQEASLRLLKALRQVTPKRTGDFYALACRHIRFELLDLVRRFRRGAPKPLHDHPELFAAGTSPAEVAELERWQALHEAVERLPDEQRAAFDLHFYQGCTWPEVAELLRINEKTARRRWRMAGMALREALGGWAPPEDEA